jgi:hypothetical protein
VVEKSLRERLEAYSSLQPIIEANYQQIKLLRSGIVAGEAVRASLPESPWTMHSVTEFGLSVATKEEIAKLHEDNQTSIQEAIYLRYVVNDVAKQYDPYVGLALHWYYISGEDMTWEDVAGKIHFPGDRKTLEKRVERFFAKMSQMSPMSEKQVV